MKFVFRYKDGTTKEFTIDGVNIIHSLDNSPVMLNIHSSGTGKVRVNASSNILPIITFLESIEVIKE